MIETRIDLSLLPFESSTVPSPIVTDAAATYCETIGAQVEVTVETDNWIPLQQIDTSPQQQTGPTVSRPDQESHWNAYNNEPNDMNRNALFEDYCRMAQYVAHQYLNSGADLDDLRQVAEFALWKSIDRFDPSQCVKFTTFATISIRGEILNYLRDKHWLIKVPRRLQENMLAVRRSADELTFKLGVLPTVAQIADHLKLTETEVQTAQELVHVYNPASLNVENSSEQNGKITSPIDRLGDVDRAFDDIEHKELLRNAFVTLSRVQRQIIYWIFFERRTQMEIASIIRKNQMYVGRQLKKALKEMHSAITISDGGSANAATTP